MQVTFGKIIRGYFGPCNHCGKYYFIKLGKKKRCKSCQNFNGFPKPEVILDFTPVYKMSKWGCKNFLVSINKIETYKELVIAKKSQYYILPSEN